LEWRTKVELFEQIRREYEFGVGTISGVANKLNIHRRMVREAIGSALPVPRKKVERPRWKLAAAIAFIDQILETDKKAPRKQRHTAHRIWERIQREMPQVQLCERTVRGYVQERKLALGLTVQETFVPQSYDWGVEAQVDWYDAYADLGGERTKLQGFSMRSMASGAAFHCAFLHATQQAFLEGHERAFAYFTGVFRRLRYDFVPGNKIIILWRIALCGGGGREPRRMCLSGGDRAHNGPGLSQHGFPFRISERRLLCSNAISSSRQRSIAYVQVGWLLRSSVTSNGWIRRATPSGTFTNEYRCCVGSQSSPSSTAPLI